MAEVGKRKRLFEYPTAIAVLALLTIAIVAAKLTFAPDPAFVNPRIASAPFAWPPGCPQKTYFEDEAIPQACAARDNYFGNGYRYGFPQQGKGVAEYYRVGDDAIDIGCSLLSTDDCRANFIVRHVFVVSPHRASIGK